MTARTDETACDLATIARCCGLAVSEHNRIQPLNDGNEIFSSILDAIDQAEKIVELQTYVYWSGDIAYRLAEHLEAAARRGVRVRVLLDGFGSRLIPSQALQRIEQHCQLRWFRPLRFWRPARNVRRSHRKILVCDHQVAFTGGVGFGEEWQEDTGEDPGWRDTHFIIHGPLVGQLHSAFLDNWIEADPQAEDGLLEYPDTLAHCDDGSRAAVSCSTASGYWSNYATVLVTLFRAARQRIWVQTPYFVPTRTIFESLMRAAESGVDVRILTAGDQTDSHMSQAAAGHRYGRLIQAGVKILQYQDRMMHTKLVLIDDHLCVVGSPNLNARSLHKDDEIALIVEDAGLSEELSATWQQDAQDCESLSYENWCKRPLRYKLLERLTYPFRHQL